MSVIISCGTDSSVKVFELNALGQSNPNLAPLFVFNTRKPKPFASLHTATLGDGRHIIFCGYQDGAIQVFDLPDFSDLGYLDGHRRNNPITCLAVDESDKLLYAASMDGNLNCFNYL